MTAARTVTLFTRPGCHLCEQARDLLRQAARGTAIAVCEVNIDADPTLRERYGVRVPVALIDDRELAWPFSLLDVRRALGR